MKIPFPLSPREIISRDPVAQNVLNSLISVCNNHVELGEVGKQKDVINQFGEQALRADLAAEEIVIKNLWLLARENGLFVGVRGEETASSLLGIPFGIKCLATLDGLDGSANYLKPCGWSYGTMFSFAQGYDPKYKDFEVAAIGLPEEGWVIVAIKNKGVFMFDIESDTCGKIEPFGLVEFDESKILSDNYFPEAKEMLGDMQDKWTRTGSTAATIVAMAIGGQINDPKFPEMNNGWQGLADVTRKGNLEQPILYLILSELGGVMVDKNGSDIGEYSFKEWGQSEKLPIISAISGNVAEAILSRLTF